VITDRVKLKYSAKNLSKYQSVYQKSLRYNPGPHNEKPVTNHLCYGRARIFYRLLCPDEYCALVMLITKFCGYIAVPAKFVPEISNDTRLGRLSTSIARVWFSFLKVPCFSFDCEISRCL
jgi:hypothetical protein